MKKNIYMIEDKKTESFNNLKQMQKDFLSLLLSNVFKNESYLLCNNNLEDQWFVKKENDKISFNTYYIYNSTLKNIMKFELDNINIDVNLINNYESEYSGYKYLTLNIYDKSLYFYNIENYEINPDLLIMSIIYFENGEIIKIDNFGNENYQKINKYYNNSLVYAFMRGIFKSLNLMYLNNYYDDNYAKLLEKNKLFQIHSFDPVELYNISLCKDMNILFSGILSNIDIINDEDMNDMISSRQFLNLLNYYQNNSQVPQYIWQKHIISNKKEFEIHLLRYKQLNYFPYKIQQKVINNSKNEDLIQVKNIYLYPYFDKYLNSNDFIDLMQDKYFTIINIENNLLNFSDLLKFKLKILNNQGSDITDEIKDQINPYIVELSVLYLQKEW